MHRAAAIPTLAARHSLAQNRRCCRGILFKGVGLTTLWPQALILLGFTLVLVAGATVRFRKGLD